VEESLITTELMGLFELWEKVKGLDIQVIEKSNFINDWEQLCWRMQIQLILAGDKKPAYLNALATLSDRIFERYRKQRRFYFLQTLLEKLSVLLADRGSPEKYRRSILKITMVSSANTLINQLNRLNIRDELLGSLKSALKDVSLNIEPSVQIIDYLRSLTSWLKRQDIITSERLTDYMISVDFNHPAFLEYVFKLFDLPNLITIDSTNLQLLEKDIKIKLFNLELVKLRLTTTLIKGIEPLVTRLHALLSTQLTWIDQKLRKQFSANENFAWLSAKHPNTGNQPIAKKLLSKWPAEKSDLVELAYGLYVYMRTRGSKVTIVALVKWFEEAFGVDLTRHSHRFAEIKMRKSTRPSKFLDVMVQEFLNYVDDGDAFFPDLNNHR
jgi:RteC protein